MILYFRLPYFHVSKSAWFSTYCFILHWHRVDTLYVVQYVVSCVTAYPFVIHFMIMRRVLLHFIIIIKSLKWVINHSLGLVGKQWYMRCTCMSYVLRHVFSAKFEYQWLHVTFFNEIMTSEPAFYQLNETFVIYCELLSPSQPRTVISDFRRFECVLKVDYPSSQSKPRTGKFVGLGVKRTSFM